MLLQFVLNKILHVNTIVYYICYGYVTIYRLPPVRQLR